MDHDPNESWIIIDLDPDQSEGMYPKGLFTWREGVLANWATWLIKLPLEG